MASILRGKAIKLLINGYLNNETNFFIIFLRNFVDLKLKTPHYLYFDDSFADENDKLRLMNDMKVIENFVTEKEESSLLKEVEPHLKRMRYESGHWDNAIKWFRELERLRWNPENWKIIERVKKLAFQSGTIALKHVHVLDLEEKGSIMPHIDSVKFCGTTIAGISLLSDSVMRLVHDKDKQKVINVLLKRRSLYIMTGTARYDYTHEILHNDYSKFGDAVVKKNRRVSVICRNEPSFSVY